MSEDSADRGKAVPMWVRQWHEKQALADLLEVSGRTLQRRVKAGDIERDDSTTPPMFRPKMTAWTGTQIEFQRTGGQPIKSCPDIGVDIQPDRVDTPDTQPDIPRQSPEESDETMSGQPDRGVRTCPPDTGHVSGHVDIEQLREDLEAHREEITRELRETREVVTEIAACVERLASSTAEFPKSEGRTEATESDSFAKGTQDHEGERGARERRQDLIWWRALLVSLLMKIKLWADRVMQRLKEKR